MLIKWRTRFKQWTDGVYVPHAQADRIPPGYMKRPWIVVALDWLVAYCSRNWMAIMATVATLAAVVALFR